VIRTSRRVRGRGTVLAAVALAAAAGLAGGCGDDGATPSQPAGQPGDADVVVVIDDVAFKNGQVSVPTGGSVTFENRDTQAHTATGAKGSFDTGTIAAGDESRVTFDEPGTYAYICSFHPFMKGTVTVG
jgi:plastocyanin